MTPARLRHDRRSARPGTADCAARGLLVPLDVRAGALPASRRRRACRRPSRRRTGSPSAPAGSTAWIDVEARVGDRPGRQARVDVRIVRRVELEIVERQLLLPVAVLRDARRVGGDGVLHRRVGLQRRCRARRRFRKTLAMIGRSDGVGASRSTIGGERHHLLERAVAAPRAGSCRRRSSGTPSSSVSTTSLRRDVAAELVRGREQESLERRRRAPARGTAACTATSRARP